MTNQDFFGSGGFPGSTPEAVERHPVLSTQTLTGDSVIRDEVNRNILKKEGRLGTRRKPETTSIFTQVAEELREFLGEMRKEIQAEIPAKFMKVAQTTKQVRARLQNMGPDERRVFARKYGTRNMAELMMKLGVQNGSSTR